MYAKLSGKIGNSWVFNQILWWKEKPILRQSSEYSKLITRAFDELSKNEGFLKSLNYTGKRTLKHNGVNDPKKTVLTVDEFLFHLNRIRNLKCLGTENKNKIHSKNLF
jgi:hypothetical protein